VDSVRRPAAINGASAEILSSPGYRGVRRAGLDSGWFPEKSDLSPTIYHVTPARIRLLPGRTRDLSVTWDKNRDTRASTKDGPESLDFSHFRLIEKCMPDTFCVEDFPSKGSVEAFIVTILPGTPGINLD
jgi:hypothetical protein